jgi:glycosyltransferase involved in cell wall biosynthesis
VKATSVNELHLTRTHILNGVTHGITQMRVLTLDPRNKNQKNKSQVFQYNSVDYDVALTWRRSPVRIRPSPSFFLESAKLEPSNGAFSDTRIMAQKKHNKDKKLHNSDEKLHNLNELDLSWQETVDLLPQDEDEGGSEIFYFTDEDGNIHSREFLTGELIDNEIKDLEASQIEKSRLEEVQRLKPGTADIVVLPYDQSTQSGALAHAFSLGKPAIVTDVGGLMAEVHASAAGVVVSRGDLDHLKEYIVMLLSKKDMREQYARRAEAYVAQRIGWEYVAGLHQSLYRSMTKDKGQSIHT